MTLSIGEVNAMDRAAFVTHFGAVYEHSPWVAERAWEAQPFRDRESLEQEMARVVLEAGRERQLELLCLHPKLGTRSELSGHSRDEQAAAGLHAAAHAQLDELRRLNREYEEKFGYPFILAVRNASVPAILDSARTRINHEKRAEFDESLRQVLRIAHFRLTDLLPEGARDRP